MYLPILRGKRFELLALRALSTIIAKSSAVMPIILPVEVTGSTNLAMDRFIVDRMPFGLIVNPYEGPLETMPLSDAKRDIIEPKLAAYDNYVPIFAVDHATGVAKISEFHKSFPMEHGFLLRGEPPSDVMRSIASSKPRFVLFVRDAVSPRSRSLFGPEVSVDLCDTFRAQRRNSDYPDEEPFSDRHVTIPDRDFANFGDYTILGAAFPSEGFAPYCVAIHYVYMAAPPRGPLSIRHYKSNSNETQSDPGGKFMEALEKLVSDVPALGPGNATTASREFQALYDQPHFPGLATIKKLSVMHHIELMTRI